MITDSKKSLGMILLITLACYAAAFQLGYVNYDDGSWISHAPILNFDVANIFTHFTAFDYIPVTLLSYSVEHAIFGFQPAISHAINLILHLTNITLLFQVLSLIFPDRKKLIFFSVLLFAIHPLNVESVAWMTERKGLLSFLFAAMSIKYFFKSIDLSLNKNIWLTGLFYALSVLSKPVSLPLPIFYGAYLCFKKKNFLKSEKMLVSVLSLLMVTLYIVHMEARNSWQAPLSNAYNLLRIPQSMGFYLSRFFVIQDYNVYYSNPSLLFNDFHLSFIILAILFGALLLARFPQNKKSVLLTLGFFVLFILPQTKIVPYGLPFIVADRYFYFAGVGLIVATVLIIEDLLEKRLVLGLLSLFALILAVSTHAQVKTWKNSETLWQQVIKTDSQSALAYNNLGLYYLEQNEVDKAYQAFQNALQADPKYSKAWINIALIYQSRHEYNEVLTALENALRIEPQNSEYLRSYNAIKSSLQK